LIDCHSAEVAEERKAEQSCNTTEQPLDITHTHTPSYTHSPHKNNDIKEHNQLINIILELVNSPEEGVGSIIEHFTLRTVG